MKVDAIVLGAGMAGIATALHLRERGRSVALVDRQGPALETSFGNAGLIQCEAVMPYAFPRDPRTILSVLLGRRTEARLRWRSLPTIAPWLAAYARASSPAAVMRTARANVPLLAHAQAEHEALMDRAGVRHLLRPGGYLRLYRTLRALERDTVEDARTRELFGVEYDVFDPDRLRREEPYLSGQLAGAVLMPTPARVEDPGDVGAGYAALFEREGGHLVAGNAASLTREGGTWTVASAAGTIAARDAVVALGPWSGELMRRLGVRVPLGIKRGYHMHYAPAGDARLNRLVIDADNGYVLAPNRRGIRLTTGAEFSVRDAPSTPVQLDRVEPKARALFPLAERLQDAPWLGARPCFPDLLPAIGPVPGHDRLWANFGHHHLGFTLGPVTGRLLAQIMTGETPFAEPAPYALSRF